MIGAPELRELLDYDPASGVFRWRHTTRGYVQKGRVAGCYTKNWYVNICVRGRNYGAHRLAWLYVHGEWPPKFIDHVNGDLSDNRIANLRPATRAQNGANRKLESNSSSGLKGVSWHKGRKKWRAQIRIDGRKKHLGLFSSKEAAAVAYRRAAVEHFSEYANFGCGCVADESDRKQRAKK